MKMNRKNQLEPVVWRLRIAQGVIVFLTLLLVLLLITWYSLQPRVNHNALIIGSNANPVATEPIHIAIQSPIELDYKTKADVLALRRQEALRYPELLSGAYAPCDQVFGQMEDNRPWWGIAGQFYYGSGENSVNGVSEEARFIVNPYLLVAAEFYGLSIWRDASLWDKTRVTPQDLERADFPYYCPPQDLLWWPQEARAEVTYALSQYLQQLNAWSSRPLTIKDAMFDLTAYNANDLSFSYIQVAHAESSNITFSQPFDVPIQNPEFIHLGGSCQYPGGCNNASPNVLEYNNMSIDFLPAQLVIYLWKNAPISSQLPPDFVFTINFR